MTWNSRIREAAYTSPSGLRLTFAYEDVSRNFDKKTTGFEFPDADGTFVQDLGHSGRRYPIRLFFWGDNYDLEADAFEGALMERGTGKLEHPIYGAVDVVPFGTVTRRDDLKTASNQAVIELTFWETIGIIYPSAQTDPASAVLSAVEGFNAELSEEFAEVTSLSSALEQSAFKNWYQSLLDNTSRNLQFLADTEENIKKQFDSIVDSVNLGIDILVSEPLALALQTVQLIQSPARALANIDARLDAYGNLANSIISGDGAALSATNGSQASNQFFTNDLYASSYVSGSVISVVNNQFATKVEALNAAETILKQLADVTDWRDQNYESLGEIDTGGSYQQLQSAVALTAGFLVEISFTLQQERRVVLDRARTIIDLAAELYGSVDDQLDFLISSNDLTGSEILEIPRGREIVYYV